MRGTSTIMSDFFEKSIFSSIMSNFKDFDFSQKTLCLGLDPQMLQRTVKGHLQRLWQSLQSFACMYLHIITSKFSSNYTSVGIGIYAVNHKNTSSRLWCSFHRSKRE